MENNETFSVAPPFANKKFLLCKFSMLCVRCGSLPPRPCIVDFSNIEVKDSLEEERCIDPVSLVRSSGFRMGGIGMSLGDEGTCFGEPLNEFVGDKLASGEVCGYWGTSLCAFEEDIMNTDMSIPSSGCFGGF